MNCCQNEGRLDAADSRTSHCCCRAGHPASLTGPVGLLIVCALVLATAWLLGAEGPPGLADEGEALYLSRCMSCHQVDGNGIPGVFPPVNDTEWVTGDKGRLIRIVLGGIMGPMKVGNVTYSGAMPPWGGYLNDQEVAALLTYMRSAWENDASPVTAEEVRLVREATADRTTPWTADELMDETNQGIPGAFGFLVAPADSTDS
ncbi:MAG: cytochrome c [Bacteroidota bacterium]|nr:cytochrome c [Bacteroidota bacterium]